MGVSNPQSATAQPAELPPSGPAGGVLDGDFPDPTFAADMATQAELDAHVNDATAAHAATAVAFTPAGTIAATTVQAAIEEVAAEAGGGSQPGAAIVRGPFPFAFNTPGLAAGVNFGVVAVGDVVLDAWVKIITPWDTATTPLFDFGCDDYSDGVFSGAAGAVPVDGNQDIDLGRGGVLSAGDENLSLAAANTSLIPTGRRLAPNVVALGGTWKLWVSQDGTKGGTAAGGVAGSAALYIVTATPVTT